MLPGLLRFVHTDSNLKFMVLCIKGRLLGSEVHNSWRQIRGKFYHFHHEKIKDKERCAKPILI